MKKNVSEQPAKRITEFFHQLGLDDAELRQHLIDLGAGSPFEVEPHNNQDSSEVTKNTVDLARLQDAELE